jgi:hypothetical protein
VHVHDGTLEGREYLENLGCSMGADIAGDRDRVVIVCFLRAQLAHAGHVVVNVRDRQNFHCQ